MSEVKLTIHGLEQNGVCSLSGKEGEVLILSMEDGTIEHGALSQKPLLQLLRMKFSQGSKKARKDAVPTAQPANGDGK
jgi:hypothetical protein